jgi:hypothetical protein
MIVAVHLAPASAGWSAAGKVQPLILSNPLCSAHQVAAAFSASAPS